MIRWASPQSDGDVCRHGQHNGTQPNRQHQLTAAAQAGQQLAAGAKQRADATRFSFNIAYARPAVQTAPQQQNGSQQSSPPPLQVCLIDAPGAAALACVTRPALLELRHVPLYPAHDRYRRFWPGCTVHNSVRAIVTARRWASRTRSSPSTKAVNETDFGAENVASQPTRCSTGFKVVPSAVVYSWAFRCLTNCSAVCGFWPSLNRAKCCPSMAPARPYYSANCPCHSPGIVSPCFQ